MNITNSGKTTIVDFFGVSDMLELIKPTNIGNHSRDNSYSRVDFSGGTWEEMIKQSTYGNVDLVDKMSAKLDNLMLGFTSESSEDVKDVYGDYFCVSEFLSGEPEHFRRSDIGKGRRALVDIIVNIGMNCGVDNDTIKNRGCIAVALYNALMSSGAIVNISLTDICLYGRKKYRTNINIPTNPVDLDEFSFVVANPMCHRRALFAVLEHLTGMSNCGSYGEPIDIVPEEGVDNLCIYFSSANHSAFDKNKKLYKTERGSTELFMSLINRIEHGERLIVV